MKKKKQKDEAKIRLKDDVKSLLCRELKVHCKGHQPVKANRYVMDSADLGYVELMFEKDDDSSANLWVKHEFVAKMLAKCPSYERKRKVWVCDDMECELYPAPGLEGSCGRHSGLKCMPQLGISTLVCFRLNKMEDLDRILNVLDSRRKSASPRGP